MTKKSGRTTTPKRAQRKPRAQTQTSARPSQEDMRASRLTILEHPLVRRTAENGQGTDADPPTSVLQGCNICPARCCRTRVDVSLVDAMTISSMLSLPFLAACTILPGTGRHSFPIEYHPAFGVPNDEWFDQGEIALRRRRDGSCVFLLEIGGYARCAAYDARPLDCRLYPVSWELGARRGGPNVVLCPVPYPLTPTRERAFMHDFELAEERWSLHDAIVRGWKKHARKTAPTIEAFIDFVAPRLAEGMGVSAEAFSARKTAENQLFDAMFEAGALTRPGPKS